MPVLRGSLPLKPLSACSKGKTGTHYDAAGGRRSPMGGQANFYINCDFSRRTMTGILIVTKSVSEAERSLIRCS